MDHSTLKRSKLRDSDKDCFDPSRFKIDKEAFVDPMVDVIPVDEKITYRSKSKSNYVIMPLETASLMPPEGRVIMFLQYLNKTSKEDDKGGWFKMNATRAEKFALTDKDARHRAICALEKRGTIEVRRFTGKSPYLRIAPSYLEILCPDHKSAGAKRGFKKNNLHILDADTGKASGCSIKSYEFPAKNVELILPQCRTLESPEMAAKADAVLSGRDIRDIGERPISDEFYGFERGVSKTPLNGAVADAGQKRRGLPD